MIVFVSGNPTIAKESCLQLVGKSNKSGLEFAYISAEETMKEMKNQKSTLGPKIGIFTSFDWSTVEWTKKEIRSQLAKCANPEKLVLLLADVCGLAGRYDLSFNIEFVVSIEPDAKLRKYMQDKRDNTLIDRHFLPPRHTVARVIAKETSSTDQISQEVLKRIEERYQEVKDHTLSPFKLDIESFGGAAIQRHEGLYDRIVAKMVKLTESKYLDFFPGTKLLQLTKDNLKNNVLGLLSSFRVFPKMVGTRYFLLIDKDEQKVVLINKSMALFDITSQFDANVIKSATKLGDTLLDGDFIVIHRMNKCVYVAKDSIAVKGLPTRKKNNHLKRIECVTSLPDELFYRRERSAAPNLDKFVKDISKRQVARPTDPKFPICVQKDFRVMDIRNLVQFTKVLEHNGILTEGIVFHHLDQYYVLGQAKSSYEWKLIEKMTVLFELRCQEHRGKYNLYAYNEVTKKYDFFDNLADTSEDYMYLDKVVVECRYDPNATTSVGSDVKEQQQGSSTKDKNSKKRTFSTLQSSERPLKKKKGGWVIVKVRAEEAYPSPVWFAKKYLEEYYTQYIHTTQELVDLLLKK